MTEKEMLEQLEDLIVDRKSLISSDSEMNEMFIKDIVALELIISKYKELKLNNTIEILEEKKKIPEKLKIEQDTPSSNYYIRNEHGTKCGLTKHSKIIADKLNEIIDYLNSKGE